jgi:hypothetical protein
MPPLEDKVLRSFLLQKAALRDVVSLAEFSASFPPSKRGNPVIRDLYRDLQNQRTVDCETVGKQINIETRLGEALIAKQFAEQQKLHIAETAASENVTEIRVMHPDASLITVVWGL